MKYYFFAFTSLFLFFGVVCTTYAGEIQYGTIKGQWKDTILLEYKGPGGTKYYTCTFDGSCESKGEKEPAMLPSVLGSKIYTTSADGLLGVKPFLLGTSVYNFLYDTSTTKPKKLTQIPFTNTGAKVSISKNGNAVVFQDGRTYTRYDIKTKVLTTLTLPQQLDFVTISPNATYVTGYNYTTLTHELWRFGDMQKTVTPSSMQSYLEFSEDESQIAFLDDVNGYRTLFTMKTSDLGKSSPASLAQVTKPKAETEDYLFANNTLYYMANVDGPLEWDLFKYAGGKTTLVEEDVSYGDFLKKLKNGEKTYLAYLKTNGKNTNVTLLGADGVKTVLSPVKDSPASTKITREVKTYGDRTGVLLSPAKKKAGNLFIWMHGGPQRQVAKGYHPYLSYAVYDELLERLAEAGNYVFKIDYTGSTGYGADFKKALSMHVGDVEMADVRNAIADIKKDTSVKNVYLIGNSYGGYMALRGIVDVPETLDGAVSINGVSDWYGLIQQIPSSPFKSVFNGVPDSHNLDAYFQASVFTGMDKLTKNDKVLVVWGEQDSTVPVWQSTKYVDFAEGQKVNVDTLSFPNEDHILRSRKNLDSLCKKVSGFLGLSKVSCRI